MPDTEIKVTGLEDANKIVRQIEERVIDLTPALNDIGNMLTTSILRNFEEGGRPSWVDLKPSTWARKTTTKILVESGMRGGLMGSIGYDLENSGRRLIVGAIQYEVPYAAAHQFGLKGRIEQSIAAHTRAAHVRRTKRGPVAVKEHQVSAHTRTINQNIPARPFVVIQPEDLIEIEQIIRDFLLQDNRR
jgi:phage gpG-like protein